MQYENERMEFKSQLTDDIYKEVIAFTNTDGGVIYQDKIYPADQLLREGAWHFKRERQQLYRSGYEKWHDGRCGGETPGSYL